MSRGERDAFLDATLESQMQAEVALHNGDVTPRLSTWSHTDPITVFGAGVPWRTGWCDVRAVFEWVASSFTSCDEYDFELIAADADGELAYTVGIERYRATTADGRVVQNELRATHVYRRENGAWKIVHRHGDHVPEDVSGTRAS